MPSKTDQKINPLQGKINDIQGEVTILTNKIAEAQKTKTSYLNVITASKALEGKYITLRAETYAYWRLAYTRRNKIKAKNREVCGVGYYQGVCKAHDVWNKVWRMWQDKRIDVTAKIKLYNSKIPGAEKIIDDLTAEKLAKQSEIQDIQDQIDQIIEDDIALAATDPDVLIAAEKGKTELSKLKEEGKQRNLVILGVIVAVIIIGSIIALKS